MRFRISKYLYNRSIRTGVTGDSKSRKKGTFFQYVSEKKEYIKSRYATFDCVVLFAHVTYLYRVKGVVFYFREKQGVF